MRLERHYWNQEDAKAGRKHCNFLGHLHKESHACVAMTGCPGLDDVELTIMSSHASNGSLSYTWFQDGTVEAIENPFTVIMTNKITALKSLADLTLFSIDWQVQSLD